jgi:hypothetical protein
MLQYADDTILLIQDNMEHARNLKILLSIWSYVWVKDKFW